jgi:isopentenyldiphosphate isomerase
MSELWQLYNEQGQPLPEQGATKQEVFSKGLLHSASHVWMWRTLNDQPEVMLQRRASAKKTWPDLLDVSAAGHVDLGEDPIDTAVRETAEELSVAIKPTELALIGVYRAYLTTGDVIENELQWLYLMRLDRPRANSFSLRTTEVSAVEWKPIEAFAQDTFSDDVTGYVPHGRTYFQLVYDTIRQAHKDGV